MVLAGDSGIPHQNTQLLRTMSFKMLWWNPTSRQWHRISLPPKRPIKRNNSLLHHEMYPRKESLGKSWICNQRRLHESRATGGPCFLTDLRKGERRCWFWGWKRGKDGGRPGFMACWGEYIEHNWLFYYDRDARWQIIQNNILTRSYSQEDN